MKPAVILEDSNDLLHALQDGAKEPLTLRAGDGDHPAVFELEWNETRPTFANITGTNIPYSQVWLYKTFPVAIYSQWHNLTVQTQGDFAAFNMDAAAYSVFTDVWIHSRAAKDQSHIGRKEWGEVTQREGIGWQTTSKNTGDSSYSATFRNCHANYTRLGWDIQTASTKGTVRWVFEHCITDSAEYGIWAQDAGEMEIRGGDYQLSQEAFHFEHCSNVKLTFPNCERNGYDVWVSSNCHQIDADNARLESVYDPGKRIRYKQRQEHRNVGSYRDARTVMEKVWAWAWK